MLTEGKIILFYSLYEGLLLSMPLCLLVLHVSLMWIQCKNFDALCVCVSVFMGPMIRGAIEVVTTIRSYTLRLPAIFGGWHFEEPANAC
jgi:hypothetical protein